MAKSRGILRWAAYHTAKYLAREAYATVLSNCKLYRYKPGDVAYVVIPSEPWMSSDYFDKVLQEQHPRLCKYMDRINNASDSSDLRWHEVVAILIGAAIGIPVMSIGEAFLERLENLTYELNDHDMWYEGGGWYKPCMILGKRRVGVECQFPANYHLPEKSISWTSSVNVYEVLAGTEILEVPESFLCKSVNESYLEKPDKVEK